MQKDNITTKTSANGATTGSTQHACAACKHQRKKCHEGCILARYFPAERTREFRAVHKVFGVSNVTKIVKSLADDEDRRKAVDSLIWEASCRQKDPVLGPYSEYRKVYDELKVYKSQENQRTASAYKSLSGLSALVGWNSNGHNGMLNGINDTYNFHDNGNIIMDQSSYASSYGQNTIPEKISEEKNNVNSIVPVVQQHQQQYSINSFNQPYYLGQFNQVNCKTVESTIWEEGS